MTQSKEPVTDVKEIIGPEDYNHVMQAVSNKGLVRPTSAQLISLLNDSYQNAGSTLSADIVDKFEHHYLWTATEHITLPNQGILIYDNIQGEKLPIDRLVAMHNARNERVRFAPYGFKTKTQSISDFLSNPLVIEHFGEAAMPIVEEIVKRLKFEPYVSALLESEKSERRYCALLLDKTTKGLALHGAGQGT